MQNRFLRTGDGSAYDCRDPGPDEPFAALKSGDAVHIQGLPHACLSVFDFENEYLLGRVENRRDAIIPYRYCEFHIFTVQLLSTPDAETIRNCRMPYNAMINNKLQFRMSIRGRAKPSHRFHI